jgi:hypothetical protein
MTSETETKIVPGAPATSPIPAIPLNIAKNLVVFLQRVPCTGMEAVAWVEAYQYVQQLAQEPGVPFTGLPPK